MTKLNEEQILEIASRYENKRDFRENEPEAYRRAAALGCLKQIKLNDERGKWGLSKLRTIAKQYGTRGEFREHDRLACVFRGDPASDSESIRPPIPILSGQ